MAGSLLRAGIKTAGYDVAPGNVERFAAAGREAALKLDRVVAGAEALVLVVLNADQVEEAPFASGGLELMSAGTIIVDRVTMARDRARAIASKVVASGCQYLHAPISGGSINAAQGELTMLVLVSGPPGAVSRAELLFCVMSTKIYNLGAVGCGLGPQAR